MKDFALIKERYLKEPFERRIAHLGSNIARLSTFIENSKNRKAVEDILNESKFFIEWMAQEAPSDVQVLLSEIQCRLALWHRHLLQQKETTNEMEELKKMAKTWSVNLLEISGLLTA